jgi:hypothetical protein
MVSVMKILIISSLLACLSLSAFAGEEKCDNKEKPVNSTAAKKCGTVRHAIPYQKLQKKKWFRNSILLNPLFTIRQWPKPDLSCKDTLA